MLEQSREFSMLACLLAVLASGLFARFHCDVFIFFFLLHDVFHFSSYKLKNSCVTLLVLFSRRQLQSNCTLKY